MEKVKIKRVGKDDIRDWVIYKITSPSGRVYIGRTCYFDKRVSSYRSETCNKQTVLHRSIKKYGFDAHKIDIIESFTSGLSKVNDKEMFWIRSFMSNYNLFPEQRGMNLTIGGDGQIGANPSAETRVKMSLKKKGKSPPNKGKPMPPHQVKMQSERMKGRPSWNKGKKFKGTDEERKLKFGAHNIGNQYNKGRPLHINTKNAAIEKNKVPVVYFDKDGTMIKRFSSIKEAAEELGFERYKVASSVRQKRLYKPIMPYFKYAEK